VTETPPHKIIDGGAEGIDRVESLWSSMVEHHRRLARSDWPVRSAEAAWALRRPQYEQWITEETGTLLLAVAASEPAAAPDGYAMVTVHPSGPSWDLGEMTGELESLVVVDAARGLGVGTLLITAARDLLRRKGVAFWSVGVVEVNHDAVRLYEREGFRPFYRQMLARIDDAEETTWPPAG